MDGIERFEHFRRGFRWGLVFGAGLILLGLFLDWML